MFSERQEKLKEEKDRQRLEEMSEDEYDALSEKEKAEVDKKRLEIKKERIRKSVHFIDRVTIHKAVYSKNVRILKKFRVSNQWFIWF